ncbi:hypothetical protein FAIPA1_70180 [Frankia sp. AiPs1]
MPGRDRDRGLALLVGLRLRAGPVVRQMFAEFGVTLDDLVELVAGEHQHGGGGQRAGGELPAQVGLGEDGVAEETAVGNHAEGAVVPVLAGGEALDLAVGDQVHRVGCRTGLDDDVPRRELPLREPVGEGGQRPTAVPAQRGQFRELPGDHPNLGADGGERDDPVAEQVGQPTVDPVDAAGGLDPGQNPQQPPGGDLLRLRDGLRGCRKISCGRRAQAQSEILAGRGRAARRGVGRNGLGHGGLHLSVVTSRDRRGVWVVQGRGTLPGADVAAWTAQIFVPCGGMPKNTPEKDADRRGSYGAGEIASRCGSGCGSAERMRARKDSARSVAR